MEKVIQWLRWIQMRKTLFKKLPHTFPGRNETYRKTFSNLTPTHPAPCLALSPVGNAAELEIFIFLWAQHPPQWHFSWGIGTG